MNSQKWKNEQANRRMGHWNLTRTKFSFSWKNQLFQGSSPFVSVMWRALILLAYVFRAEERLQILTCEEFCTT